MRTYQLYLVHQTNVFPCAPPRQTTSQSNCGLRACPILPGSFKSILSSRVASLDNVVVPWVYQPYLVHQTNIFSMHCLAGQRYSRVVPWCGRINLIWCIKLMFFSLRAASLDNVAVGLWLAGVSILPGTFKPILFSRVASLDNVVVPWVYQPYLVHQTNIFPMHCLARLHYSRVVPWCGCVQSYQNQYYPRASPC